MELKDITITSLSISGDPKGNETLYIAAAYGKPGEEVFVTKTISKSTITVQTLVDALGSISETAGAK